MRRAKSDVVCENLRNLAPAAIVIASTGKNKGFEKRGDPRAGQAGAGTSLKMYRNAAIFLKLAPPSSIPIPPAAPVRVPVVVAVIAVITSSPAVTVVPIAPMLRQLPPLALYRLTVAAELVTARAITPIATVFLSRFTQIASIFPIFAICASIISVPSVRQRWGRRNQKTEACEKDRSGNPSFCIRHVRILLPCVRRATRPKVTRKLGGAYRNITTRFPMWRKGASMLKLYAFSSLMSEIFLQRFPERCRAFVCRRNSKRNQARFLA